MNQPRLFARHAAVVLALATAALTSHAAVVTVSGTSTSDAGTTPEPGAAADAREEFLKLVDPLSVRTEGFESFDVGQTFQDASAPSLRFVLTTGSTGAGTPETGRLIPSPPLPPGDNNHPDPPKQNPGLIASSTSAAFAGRFNTTGGFNSGAWAGGKWWEATGDFEIEFDSGVNGFGFYLTDSNDFLGILDLILVDLDGAESKLPGITGTSAAENGSLQFFGFFDDAKTYKKVRFDIFQPGGTAPTNFDVFGLDDLLIAAKTKAPTPAPEPGSLALVGLALFAAGWGRKTQRRA